MGPRYEGIPKRTYKGVSPLSFGFLTSASAPTSSRATASFPALTRTRSPQDGMTHDNRKHTGYVKCSPPTFVNFIYLCPLLEEVLGSIKCARERGPMQSSPAIL